MVKHDKGIQGKDLVEIYDYFARLRNDGIVARDSFATDMEQYHDKYHEYLGRLAVLKEITEILNPLEHGFEKDELEDTRDFIAAEWNKKYGFPERKIAETRAIFTPDENWNGETKGDMKESQSHDVRAGDLKSVVVLTCTHETKYGVNTYTSVHSDPAAALANVEAVQKTCDYAENNDGEYFNFDIDEQVVDVSKLAPVKAEAKAEEKVAATEQKELSVSTPLGDIVVAIKTDSEYPGVYVDLKGDKVNDTYEVNTAGLATIEFDPIKGTIQSVVYGDAHKDEPTHIVEHENVEKVFSLDEKQNVVKEMENKEEIEFYRDTVLEQAFLLMDSGYCTEEQRTYIEEHIDEVTSSYATKCNAWEAENGKEAPLSIEMGIMHSAILEMAEKTPQKVSLDSKIQGAEIKKSPDARKGRKAEVER